MNEHQSRVPVLESIAPLAPRYKVWLCDIWGVMHDGIAPFPEAVRACIAFRGTGGVVVLISNSPRPHPQVVQQLTEIGVPHSTYDHIVTSGDVTRSLLRRHSGTKIFHLGPQRDRPILDGIDVAITGPGEAELVLCSGLFDDETETPDDYTELLSHLAAHDLPMICANPDLMVERGNRLVYCAGALAQIYEKYGGKVTYAGKPHSPIYETAFEKIAAHLGGKFDLSAVVAIGDGIKTDIAGAMNFGLDTVFVASGLHMAGNASAAPLEQAELARIFAGLPRWPVAALKRLKW